MTDVLGPRLAGGRASGADAVAAVLAGGGVAVLSGAGLSTESGIPDYRGPTGRARAASPMTLQEFLGSTRAQQRYWARSYAGWPLIEAAQPNLGHVAVTALQRLGVIESLITQNVDGLHAAAGSTDVVELHGALSRVVCWGCGAGSARRELQQRLAAANPDLDALLQSGTSRDELGGAPAAAVRPDGDVALDERWVHGFSLVPCLACGRGPLKPDVVFFGEVVPTQRVQRCYELVDRARTLLVLGSSLTVMSGYRFVRHMAKRQRPIVIVNQGPTRGDARATLRVDEPLGALLPAVAARLRRAA